MLRRSAAPMWKSRIVGHGAEPPDQLLAHPANAWKIHPDEQANEVEKMMEAVGWVREVLVNRRTGYVIDGHLRIRLALRHDEETVPVTYIDVSPEEERALVLLLDPLAGLIGRDVEQLAPLMEQVGVDLAGADLDLAGILKTAKEPTVGLSHDVHECLCCQKKCRPKCGCYREPERKRRGR